MAKKLNEILKKNDATDPKAAKLAKIASLCTNIQKKFGKESVNYLGNNKAEALPRFSSGGIAIDKILGGGIPEGRIIEIFGGESSGKTTLCYHALHEFQKKYPEGMCAFVDEEGTFDPVYAANIGVDVRELIVAQPESGNDAFQMVQNLIENGVGLVIVDSVAAMLPKDEAEADNYDGKGVALQARLMSQGLRKLNPFLNKYKATIIFTNQTRTNVAILYGQKDQSAGGKALRYYASIRLQLQAGQKVKETVGGEEIVRAIEINATTAKNKTAAPFAKTKFTIVFGNGIDNDAGIVEMAISEGIIVKKGGWFSYNGENIAQGMPNVRTYLEEHQDIYEEIKQKIKSMMAENVEQASEAIDADGMTDDEIAESVMKDSDETEVGEI